MAVAARWWLPFGLAAAASASALARAQQPRPEDLYEARFVSEFRRLDARGEVIAADAAGAPREIISPALVRNGFTSFRIVLKGPPGQPYWFFIAQNPEGLLRPTLYRIAPAAAAGTGAPPLEKLPEPLKASGKLNEHGVALYWIDIWTPAATPVRRIRLEAQVSAGGGWIITPLEARVMAASVPEKPAARARASLAGTGRHAGVFAQSLFAGFFCGGGGGAAAAAVVRTPVAGSEEARLHRNAAQDLLIAEKIGFAQTRPALESIVARALGVASIGDWCSAGGAAAAAGAVDPETFLRVRDALWRADR